MNYRLSVASYGLTTLACISHTQSQYTPLYIAVGSGVGHCLTLVPNEIISTVGESIAFAIHNAIPGILTEYVFQEMKDFMGYGETFAYLAGLSVTCIRTYRALAAHRRARLFQTQ